MEDHGHDVEGAMVFVFPKVAALVDEDAQCRQHAPWVKRWRG